MPSLRWYTDRDLTGRAPDDETFGVCHMKAVRVRLGKGGRLVIPAEYRKTLGLREGDEVVVQLSGEELRVFAVRRAVRYAQGLVRQYVAADRSLAEELIRERRQEAADE